MAAEMIKFPSIEQYRNTVKRVREQCAHHGVPLPSIKFTGTVKLHGTNAAIGYNYRTNKLWVQSRNNIITPEADNMGFARYVEESKPFWLEFFSQFGSGLAAEDDKVIVYGEWCGQGIMKGVAVSQLPKTFIIFDVRVVGGLGDSVWAFPREVKTVLDKIPVKPAHFIYDFPTYWCVIDFARPEEMQNKLSEWTQQVEQRCPVGAFFGVDGVGEGIVWRPDLEEAANRSDLPFDIDDLIFKVKGEKHSDTKVKTLAAVDTEKLASVQAFVDAVITDHRLEKGVAFLKEQGKDTDIKNIGEFLKWVGQDVLKEEADTLQESGLDRKDVMPKVAAAAKQWYLKLPT